MPKQSTPHRWAIHFKRLCDEIKRCRGTPAAKSPRQEIWKIIHVTLSRYLTYHAARLGQIDPQDLEDIASQKSLDLIGGIDTLTGRLLELRASEVAGFLSTVARNGLVDFLRSTRRHASVRVGEETEEDTIAPPAPITDIPDAQVEQGEFALAMRKCVEALEARARLVWMFRVFYDMPTKQIAAHRRVGLKPGHVDVVLQRAREAVRGCMEASGHAPQEMPPGTFATLWTLLHPLAAEESKETM